MVKCSECGFLASRNVQSRQLEETEQEIRMEGGPVIVWNTEKPLHHTEPPICFMRVEDYKSIPYTLFGDNDMVKSEIQRERTCKDFIPWQQGFTPKEHREMMDRKLMLEMEEKRKRNDRKWHWIELFVTLAFGAIIALISTIIARG